MKADKITFVVGLLLQGGAERVIANLSWEMAERGSNIVILSYYDKEPVYAIHPSIKLIKVQKETGSKNVIRNLLFMRKIFRQRKGVVYSFIAVFNMLSIIAHAGLQSKLIVADRNDPNRIPKQLFLRKLRNLLYRFSDVVVVQTGANAVYFERRIPTLVKVICNPLELGGKDGQALRTAKEDMIVTVGRLVGQKNHGMLIKAFQMAHDALPSYRLVIYGEGDRKGELEEMISYLGLSGCIDLPGNCSDIYDKISSAKLFVLTSNFEGMPNALAEAMGLGLPVVSTRVSGATDLIQNYENGELVDIDDHKELAEKMIRILRDEGLQRKYGENAKKICMGLNKKKITEEWMALNE